MISVLPDLQQIVFGGWRKLVGISELHSGDRNLAFDVIHCKLGVVVDLGVLKIGHPTTTVVPGNVFPGFRIEYDVRHKIREGTMLRTIALCH